MATFLDVTGLEYFTSIFVFLFVWLVVYATLLWTKALGSNKFINALAGLLIGIFALISPLATSVIASTAPMLAVVLLGAVMLNVALKMLGTDIEAFHSIKVILLVLVLMILIVTAGVKIRDQVNLEPSDDLSKSVNLFFHPKFLGMILILSISVFTIALLASRSG